MVTKGKRSYIIKQVSSALDILEQFRDGADELGITELSQRLKLHKNKVFRILATLETRNYIEQNRHTESYRLGLKNLDLGQTFSNQMGLLRQSKPVLQSLTRDCNETSCVSIMRDFAVVHLDSVETDLPVRAVPRIGTRIPFHCSAAGKVLAAHLDRNEITAHLNARSLTKFTANTMADVEALMRHLHDVARNGYAVEDEELDVGVRGVGAPILDYRRMVVGAVIVSGPSPRFSGERLEGELIPRVRSAALEISARLGYSP
jgi:DNA-binding IclR family transcriptional regulator